MTSQSEPTALRPAPAGNGTALGAVVTEASRPIGWGVARTLARLGYAVHLTDLDGRVAARTAAELGAPSFGSALDPRSLPACRAAASRTRRRLGSLELWVNTAAMAGSLPIWEVDERTRQRMLDLILLGTINGTLAALEVMRRERRGDVINVIELFRLLPLSGQAVYSAAQHGVLAFSQGVRADLRATGLREVNVSCLCLTRRLVDRSPRLEAGLVDLLDHPRPVLAVPRWRGALVRASCLWPTSGARLASALLDPARAGRRPRRRRPA